MRICPVCKGSGKVPSLPLSPRELEIGEKVAEGLTNAEIATALEISEQTVKNHVTSILDKLGLKNRVQMALYITSKVQREVNSADGQQDNKVYSPGSITSNTSPNQSNNQNEHGLTH